MAQQPASKYKPPPGSIIVAPSDLLDSLPVVNENEQPASPPPSAFDIVRALVSSLPAIGGAAGGMLGGAGGTAAGFGFGGIPGAVGGAALGGGAGEAAKQHINRFILGKEAPGSMTDAATDIGVQGAVQGGIEGAGGLVGKGVKAAGTAVYRGYLKPSLAGTELAKAREIVETGIREMLPVTKAGENRGNRIISEINGQVETLLKNNTGKVDLKKVADEVRAFASRKYNRPGVPSSDYEAALKVADDIDKHASLGIPAGAKPTRVDVTTSQANDVKRALDQAAGDKAFGVERGAATEARKAGRHAVREGIENVAGDVGALNARESKLIDAVDSIARASGREENRNALFGVPTLLSSAASGASLAKDGDPVTAIITGLTMRGLLSPAVATRAGFLAAKFYNVAGTSATTAARMGVILAQRESEEKGQ